MSRTTKIVVVIAILAVAAPVGAALLARIFVIEAFAIPSGGMMPTLVPGDHIFVAKSRYGLQGHAPRIGEIVVFSYPRDRTKDFIKRIVGVAGDVLEVRDGALVRNGAPVPRCSVGEYEYEDTGVDAQAEQRRAHLYVERLGTIVYLAIHDPEPSIGAAGPWRVRSGEVFVVGDNRDNSHDSRYWGGVPLADLKGRASSIWSSPVSGRAGTDLHAPAVLPAPLPPAVLRCVAEVSSGRRR